MSKINDFFDETTEQSKVKSNIVSKYFTAWASVMVPSVKKIGGSKIAYIDLFSGPGKYDDGTKSTPLRILEGAAKNPDLMKMLVTIFNDADKEHTANLKKEIELIHGIKNFKNQPKIFTGIIDKQVAEIFEKSKLMPSCIFLDPFGYKGLSLRLIASLLKDWGCDCIFFFNYIRINAALNNPALKNRIDELFGEELASELRSRSKFLSVEKRELMILDYVEKALKKTLKKKGGNYVLTFRFKNDEGTRTTHYLIFVCKDFKGYEIMKDIMAKESSKIIEGVSSFEYNPTDKEYYSLFALMNPLEDLKKDLLSKFARKKLTMNKIYQSHTVGTPFIKKNYKEALAFLEFEGKIVVEPPACKRRKKNGKITFGDNVLVTFS